MAYLACPSARAVFAVASVASATIGSPSGGFSRRWNPQGLGQLTPSSIALTPSSDHE